MGARTSFNVFTCEFEKRCYTAFSPECPGSLNFMLIKEGSVKMNLVQINRGAVFSTIK